MSILANFLNSFRFVFYSYLLLHNFENLMRPKKLLPDRKNLGMDLKQVSNKMEEKLNQLKSLMQKQKQDRELKSTQRWSSKNSQPTADSTPKTTKPPSMEPQVQALHDFLQSINMLQYEEKLLKAGVDSLDILREMNKHHMEEIGIVKGHIVKISKYLGKGQQGRPETATSSQHEPIIVKQPQTTKQIPKTQQMPKRSLTAVCFQDCQTDALPLPERKPHLYCEKCYLPFEQVNRKGSKFCSEKCETAYHSQNYVNCSTCNKQQQKWDCFKADDSYYCSQDCLKLYLQQTQRQEILLQAQQSQDIFYQLQQPASQPEQEAINLNQFLEIQKYLQQ